MKFARGITTPRVVRNFFLVHVKRVSSVSIVTGFE